MDDCLLFNEQFTGTFTDVFLTAHGLMNDFSARSFWEGVVIGDRTIMVSPGGLPKVFNGKTCTKAGLQRWTGGVFKTELIAGGKLTKNRWYHLRVVYHDDFDQIQAVSPPIVFLTDGTNLTVRIRNLPQHPDPRVTSIRLYATPGMASEDLARATTPQLADVGVIENFTRTGQFGGIDYGAVTADADLLPVDLALDIIPPPVLSTVASHNGRLVGGGSPILPDAVFYTNPGNPEAFTEGGLLVLPEGTGDRIIKVISAFGSLFVFKTNSIWRLDEIQPGVTGSPFARTKITDGLGAASARSICLHVHPDTGRQFIFFWSKSGPYLFDGVNIIYIGQPLERNLDDEAWSWFDTPRSQTP